MAEHTPTPWVMKNHRWYGSSGDQVTFSRLALGGNPVEAAANEALVLKAVNAHDKLTRDNAAMIEALETVDQWFKERGYSSKGPMRNRILAALAQAKGEA